MLLIDPVDICCLRTLISHFSGFIPKGFENFKKKGNFNKKNKDIIQTKQKKIKEKKKNYQFNSISSHMVVFLLFCCFVVASCSSPFSFQKDEQILYETTKLKQQ